ncbi:uncharacterized protein Z520_04959 [Fonsecaea multimorphosa CBS 102226]|uniref:Major facilitator superfamily (MFS) profile domain-containing protein n=1 Tax=Fonsecaea multimorphosa CBS 102226 TaxID=1442371 RepID=A0A0D2KRS5_9EURO|nr:uncharacterized protein Z520_04959 [Fonsecaea multimorphosa CBS 102226]KIX99383.1 hypothetical protein Z520_04959 [Fonsecaea multimorphosa CBS 102226]OAL25711.1 hypothetical protein AYO22_04700 [Fonsecaea multimorphosa]
MALSASMLRLLIVVFVALGSVTYGYCASIIGTTLGQPSFISYFELDTRPNASGLIGATNGLFQTGGLFGTLSCMKSADWLGRRKALFVASIVTTVGGALQAGSVHIAMYIVARLITGLGIGALVTLVPLYQSEVAPPKIRGLLVGIHGIMICVGYTSASWIGVGFYFVQAAGAQWRIPLAVQAVWPALLAMGVLFLPESPRWLLDHDRFDEAYSSFKRVRAETSDSFLDDEDAIRADFTLLHSQILEEKQEQLSTLDLFKLPGYRKRVGIGFIMMVGAQATGTQIINNYGPMLYKNLGFDTVQQLIIQAGWISVSPFGNAINALFVDKVGRVKMLILGMSGCVLALVGEVITLSQFQEHGGQGSASAAVFFLFLHVAIFASTIDATSYIYASEIFPTPVRAKGLSLSISGLFLTALALLQGAPTGFADIGWKYYLVCIGATSAVIVVIWWKFPETKMMSLEEIGSLFADPSKALGEKASVKVRRASSDEETEKDNSQVEVERVRA